MQIPQNSFLKKLMTTFSILHGDIQKNICYDKNCHMLLIMTLTSTHHQVIVVQRS